MSRSAQAHNYFFLNADNEVKSNFLLSYPVSRCFADLSFNCCLKAVNFKVLVMRIKYLFFLCFLYLNSLKLDISIWLNHQLIQIASFSKTLNICMYLCKYWFQSYTWMELSNKMFFAVTCISTPHLILTRRVTHVNHVC